MIKKLKLRMEHHMFTAMEQLSNLELEWYPEDERNRITQQRLMQSWLDTAHKT